MVLAVPLAGIDGTLGLAMREAARIEAAAHGVALEVVDVSGGSYLNPHRDEGVDHERDVEGARRAARAAAARHDVVAVVVGPRRDVAEAAASVHGVRVIAVAPWWAAGAGECVCASRARLMSVTADVRRALGPGARAVGFDDEHIVVGDARAARTITSSAYRIAAGHRDFDARSGVAGRLFVRDPFPVPDGPSMERFRGQFRARAGSVPFGEAYYAAAAMDVAVARPGQRVPTVLGTVTIVRRAWPGAPVRFVAR